jgi:hypothetical protein
LLAVLRVVMVVELVLVQFFHYPKSNLEAFEMNEIVSLYDQKSFK